MYNEYFAQDKTKIMEEINNTIDLMYITQCRATKNALLNRLRRLLVELTSYARPGIYGEAVTASQENDPALIAPPSAMQSLPQSTGMQRNQQRMQPGMPQGMTQGMPQGMIQGMPQGMSPAAPRTMAPTAPTAPRNMAPMAPTAPSAPPPAAQRPQIPERTFTLSELERYDGKGNNPAYVAVNGIVYDVTEQPGWAAGSHFGLKSGLDQTSAYVSCHTGQPMLDKLKAIGRLVK
jgi:predicted heme/steroid binding protein